MFHDSKSQSHVRVLESHSRQYHELNAQYEAINELLSNVRQEKNMSSINKSNGLRIRHHGL